MDRDIILARRPFTEADQEAFASLSADRNPMHMDPLFARRTQAGAPVVHGMHLLLWALDALAAQDGGLIRSVLARFSKFVYVGEEAEVVRTGDGVKFRLEIRVGGGVRSQFVVQSGPPTEVPATIRDASTVPFADRPIELDLAEVTKSTGALELAPSLDASLRMFPSASGLLGVKRMAGIAATSRLVGMVVPGLHSIYTEAALTLSEEAGEGPVLAYRVDDVDDRFRMVRIAVEGPGMRGALKTFVRVPPVAQASMASLRGVVAPDAFSGHVALIVGGSRGLGELTAKLVALGGGHVVVTYRSGRADAEAVAAEIRREGGAATVLRYDSSESPEAQLANLANAPTHAYYFATPTIFRHQSELFSPERLGELMDAYVQGFWGLVEALLRRNPAVSLFYPSTVFVEERPKGMTEYAMAKAAGESLCADINEALAPTHVTVTRLPRLLTDQTATVTAVETASPVEVMLPIVREVQSWPMPATS